MTPQRTQFLLVLTSATAILLSSAVAHSAEDTTLEGTPAELLQKAIYQEETTGDLKQAKQLYRQIVEQGKQLSKIAAEAQYRLATCLLKEGQKDEAKQAFQQVIDQFGEQSAWVEKAKQHLDDTIQLLPPPFPSGVRETLVMKLAGGLPVGLVGCGAEKQSANGQETWRFYVRRMVSVASNEGASTMVVDANRFTPIQTSFEHLLLGDTQAHWGTKELSLEMTGGDGKKQTKTVELDATAYCNDQWFFGFRQLPLAIGYEATLPIRVAFTGGNAIDLQVSVNEMETIQTPYGEFECFKLDTNIGQTFWIANVPQRYLAKFDGGGVVATLTSVRPKGESEMLKVPQHGLQVLLPGGWFSMDLPRPPQSEKTGLLLASTDLSSSIVACRDRDTLSKEAEEDVKAWLQKNLESARGALKDFVETAPPAPVQAGKLDGISATGTFTAGPYRMKRQSIYAFHEGKAIEIHHTSTETSFEKAATMFEKINASLSF